MPPTNERRKNPITLTSEDETRKHIVELTCQQNEIQQALKEINGQQDYEGYQSLMCQLREVRAALASSL